MMANEKMKNVQAEIKRLGILNIEASGDLTPDAICDAVDAVKEINLNFKELAKKAAQYRTNPQR